ncbi:class I SAM-dependent methyltransferase [Acaryochloris sp. IP29b_bin.137]|uniref:class I SAM-dependent methyltransferase n=1 Tax=Acaryochloris sp. IP29b_bin.137 TaxID=2969217 RepID=UPI00260A810E|nr:class I SAM-dependent methyltransferase [Acaryochloris sp. IP29b_bin.137]
METDYAGHDRAYQRKRVDPDYAGWTRHDEVVGDWHNTWQPLSQKQAFPDQGNLLELGCGAGNLGIAFAQVGYTVTGVDIALTAIAWAVENAAKANVKVNFLQGDVLTLTEIEDDSFDIALDGRCFHCIIGCDRTQFLHTAHRILKPNGVLTITTMCNQVPVSLQPNFDPQTRCIVHKDVATRYIGDSNDILQEIIQADFQILDVEVVPPSSEDDAADLQVIATKR